ncbi:MAG TPA: S8 family serine peptidase, partial [Xanthomonadales bacterium]|nr:S8 family serine peptidase [Xanthomonadales bacterium]
MLSRLKWTAILLAAVTASGVTAQSKPPAVGGLQRYVIQFHDAPLASFQGGKPAGAELVAVERTFEATSPLVTREFKLDVRSPRSQAYLRYLDSTHEAFRLDAAVLLGHTVAPLQVYRNALNGMAVDLTAAEASELLASPFVKSIGKDTRHRLDTDAGPEWIGAAQLWGGQSGFAATKGEGVVIGIIDSGINWDHPSFADPGSDGFDHVNPFGSQLGLCGDPEVTCNDKVAAIYDFVEDDPSTTDVVEENTKGKDNSGHGSHVSAIAAGNTLNVTLNGTANATLSGVAPHANVVVYRACYIGEPVDAGGGGCMATAILSAIDQAIADGVDVINYSIGTDASNPWSPGGIPLAFLNARNAGIFIATSTGNAGPNAGTIGSPANAPWVVAAGNATHNRIFGSIVQNLSGGASPPPANLVGASLTGGIASRKIVHARDFGFALCGSGTAELKPSCQENSGQSNPWKGTTPFNGEIVVCDRGTYGRIEKSKNLLLAGAGGYILANTDATAESLDSDEHCLPASHIGDQDGDTLRNWLASGSNHTGSISGFVLAEADKFADRINSSSSRGPVLAPVQNTLKPNLIAPGTSILSASDTAQEFAVLTGTSMASPHIAGAAALVRAVHPGWSVAQVASALETTATSALATVEDGSVATPHQRGAGRPRLGLAVDAGLYLNVTGAQFSNANPTTGGNPKNLNLPALVDAACFQSCVFSRTVTDQMGGGNWTATATNFPAGTQVTISPAGFTLANGAARTLGITINLQPVGIVGAWVYGDIVLSAAGSSSQVLTTAVYSDGGALPSEWSITDDRDSGYKEFQLSGLAAMPDATFSSGGLVAPTLTTRKLVQDPTSANPAAEKGKRNIIANEDPFDGGQGVFTVWHDLPQGGLWLHAETLATTATDIDLFVGRDDNQDGVADEEEQLCESTSPQAIELCDMYNLPPGNYWAVVQNWDGNLQGGDDVTLLSAAVDADDQASLVATGPGIVTPSGTAFKIRTSWSNINALPGEQWLGAVGIGTSRNSPNNIGVIPLRFNRSGLAAPQTLPLANGKSHKVALAGNSAHDRMFIDIPVGVTALNLVAQGNGNTQNNALKIDVFREDFNTALGTPPFAQLPGGLAALATSSGSGGNGPAI